MTRRHWIRLAFAALAVVFFATPLVLTAFGYKARAFENRKLASAPRLSEGWGFFDDATRYLIDHLPLRYQAVHANTWIDLNVFAFTPRYGLNGLGGVQSDQALPFTGQPDQDKAAVATSTATGKGAKGPVQPPPTADQVAVGLHGWYYLQGVWDRACSPFIPFTQAVSRWETLIRVIRASGRRVELVVAPDKQKIYPEYVAPGTPNLACGKLGTAQLWRLLEAPAAVRAGIVGLRKLLLAEKRTSSQPLYFRTDSHWNNLGSLSFPEAALPPLSKTVRLRPDEIVAGPKVKYTGDLLGLLGQSGSEIAPTAGIHRAPGSPVVAGRSVVVGDSYADTALGDLTPYFASLNLLYWVNNTPQEIANGIASARNVVLETVEREFDYRASDNVYITPGFIAYVRKTLAAHPLRPR
jgi:alginate O-acetyltransferase complex protein AlgJ